ncbi:MAG: hypothetical protein ACKO5K_03435 [Armatimonadota bacterium]
MPTMLWRRGAAVLPALAWCVAAGLPVASMGCGGGSSAASTRTATLSVTVAWPDRSAGRLVPLASESIRVTVAGANGFAKTVTIVRPANSTTIANLPVGDLVVTATAHPAADPGATIPQASAVRTVPGRAGQTTPLALSLESTIDRVAVTAGSGTLRRGASATATIEAYDPSNRLVLTRPSTWELVSLDPGICAVRSAADGFVLEGIARGAATVRATETESGKVSTVSVVVASPPPVLVFTGPSTERLVGETSTLAWEAQDASTLTSVGFSAAGMIGNAAVAPTKTALYTLKATNELGEVAEKSVEIRVATVGVSVTPTAGEIDIRKSLKFAATVSGAVDTTVAWSVIEPLGGTIATDGTYTAPAAQGTFHVRATSTADPSRVAEVAVRVRASGGGIEIR